MRASTDVTYCQNDKCKKKCWRHKDNYSFKKDELYWFFNGTETCKERIEREDKENGI